jgi:hypothetical protein
MDPAQRGGVGEKSPDKKKLGNRESQNNLKSGSSKTITLMYSSDDLKSGFRGKWALAQLLGTTSH